MIKFNCLWITIFLSAFCYCSSTHAQSDIKQVWIAREGNGCKPGIEYRLWLSDENRIVGEMWLFTTDENNKEKERGKYPTTIKTSDHNYVTFTYKSGDGSADEFTIRFPNGLKNRQEQAVLEDMLHRKQELKFERSDK